MRNDLKARRQALKQRLRELSAVLAGEPEAGPEPSLAAHAAEAEIASIHAALGRMDRGEYGCCASCGEEIEDARLDRLPFTAHCGSCAAQLR